jgi:CDP-4-dehydro-6-deoxyglucose reductase
MVVQKTEAIVEQMVPLTNTIMQLVLAPELYIDYQAGQYLQLLLGDTPLCYSIANAPLGSRKYELHIRHNHENRSDVGLFNQIKQHGRILLQAPFGMCDYQHLDRSKPILFIAAGTGFAPVKAMIEQLLTVGSKTPFELIWTARTKNDLYLDEKVNQWQNHVQQFHYTPLLTSLDKTSLIHVVLSRCAQTLPDWQIVLSGPFDMVYSTRDQLVAHGVSLNSLYSDAFQFEDKL